MSWGLLTKPWSGWRRASTDSSGASTGGSRRSGEPKRFIFKGRACTESSFLDFGTGPGFGEVQNGSFIKAALVQNRHF